jgi:hypothetical protein
MIGGGVRLLAEFGQLPVDAHAPRNDEFLAGAARTETCLRQYFLYSFLHNDFL